MAGREGWCGKSSFCKIKIKMCFFERKKKKTTFSISIEKDSLGAVLQMKDGIVGFFPFLRARGKKGKRKRFVVWMDGI